MVLFTYFHVGAGPDHDKKNAARPSRRKTSSVNGKHASLEILCLGGCRRGVCRLLCRRRVCFGAGPHLGAVCLGRAPAGRNRPAPNHACRSRCAARHHGLARSLSCPGHGIHADDEQRALSAAPPPRWHGRAACDQRTPRERPLPGLGARRQLGHGPHRAQLHHAAGSAHLAPPRARRDGIPPDLRTVTGHRHRPGGARARRTAQRRAR